MIDFVNSLKSFIKREDVYIDNSVFQLHYKFTVILFIAFSVLLTSKQFFGEPITCDVDFKDRKSLIDTFCWIHGTYIIKRNLNRTLPGAGNVYDDNEIRKYSEQILNLYQVPDDKIIWQKYYQWVCIVFCFQSLLFYIPRYLWKSWESGRVALLVKNLSGPLVTPDWNEKSKEKFIRHLMTGKISHNIYAARYIFCEFLNLINTGLQIYFMDFFLTGQFSYYGLAYATFNNLNPMDQVFPKIAKCTYYRFGPTNTLENEDALCILPLNVLNEKLFLILWFWLHILFLLTAVYCCFRICTLISPTIRMYLLIGHYRFMGCKKMYTVVKDLSYGDFFILDQIGKNVNPLIFFEIMDGVHKSILMQNSAILRKYKHLQNDV